MITPQTAGRTYAGDVAEIQQAALDYMQGWYEGDAERMRRSLHPELAKRAILSDPQTGAERFHHLSQQQMVTKTAQDKWLIVNVLWTENRDRAMQQSEPS